MYVNTRKKNTNSFSHLRLKPKGFEKRYVRTCQKPSGNVWTSYREGKSQFG